MENLRLLAVDPNFNLDEYTWELEDEVVRVFTQSAELAYVNGKLELGLELQNDDLDTIGEKLKDFTRANFTEVLFLDESKNLIDRFSISSIVEFHRLRNLVG